MEAVFNPLMLNTLAGGGQFGQYKIMQIKLKITQTLAHVYSFISTQLELSYEYQHDCVLYGFHIFFSDCAFGETFPQHHKG